MKGTVKYIALVALSLGLNGQAALADQSVDLNLLGAASAEALRNNGAQINMTQSDGGYSVRISQPSKLEHGFGSPKLDQFALDKEVTFNLSENPDGSVHLSNIKGFKIHSVEKQMWVNLYGVDFGAPDAQGQHESVISAGKMGVVKQVPTSISPRTFEPIAGFIASIHGTTAPTTLPNIGQPDPNVQMTAAGQPSYNQVPAAMSAPPATTSAVPPSQGWSDPPQTNPYGTAGGASQNSFGGLAGGSTGGAPSTYAPAQPTTVQSSYSQPPSTQPNYVPPQQSVNTPAYSSTPAYTSPPAYSSTPAYSSAPAYSAPAYSAPAYTAPPQTTPGYASTPAVTNTRVYAAPDASGNGLTGNAAYSNPAPTNPAASSYGNSNFGNGILDSNGGINKEQGIGILKEAVGTIKKILDDDDDDNDKDKDDDDDRDEMKRKQQNNMNNSNRHRDDDDDDDGD